MAAPKKFPRAMRSWNTLSAKCTRRTRVQASSSNRTTNTRKKHAVQCLPGMLDDEAVATATLSSAPTVTFVAGSGTALPWLERGVMGCRRGDILHASDAEGRVAYTVSIRFVAAAPATQTEDRVTRADEHRKLGNELLKKRFPNAWMCAMLSYRTTAHFRYSRPNRTLRSVPRRFASTLRSLSSVCKNGRRSTRQCDIVLASDPTNTKALFRRGRVAL
eukprot:IDg8206t1